MEAEVTERLEQEINTISWHQDAGVEPVPRGSQPQITVRFQLDRDVGRGGAGRAGPGGPGPGA
jgi:multidrug efflux pump subunit AcrB